MKTILAGFAVVALIGSVDIASAQVRPQWTYDGSAVCPEGMTTDAARAGPAVTAGTGRVTAAEVR